MTPVNTTSTTTQSTSAAPASAPTVTALILPAAPVSTGKMIVFEEVSKFYGEILAVNRVNTQIAPGITSFVGPNGFGKTTLVPFWTASI